MGGPGPAPIPGPPTLARAAAAAGPATARGFAIADSGSTGHYIAEGDLAYLVDVTPAPHPLTVCLPDGSNATSTHTALLDLPSLPVAARRCHVFPSFRHSLLSIPLLCDVPQVECIFRAGEVQVLHRGEVVLLGHRSESWPLWMVPLVRSRCTAATHHAENPNTAAMTVPATTTARRVAFFHAALGSPPLSTFVQAVRRGYVTFPALTVDAISAHPPNTVATAKGHLDQTRQRPRTATRDIPPPSRQKSGGGPRPAHMTAITALHTDATGDLPVVSRAGNRFLMIFLLAETGYIHVVPLSSASAASVTAALRDTIDFFAGLDVAVDFVFADNMLSNEQRRYMQRAKLAFQLCPPNDHRANRAERAIRTVKNHIVSMMAAADKDFPANLWDLLMPHVELCVNLYRPAANNSFISAWHATRGPFAYDHHPFGPPGHRILAFEARVDRGSWSPHGREAWYLGPSLEHYDSHRVWLHSTCASRVVRSLSWHLPPHLLPTPTATDEVVAATRDLSSALQRLAGGDNPGLTDAARSITQSLEQLQQVLASDSGGEPDPPGRAQSPSSGTTDPGVGRRRPRARGSTAGAADAATAAEGARYAAGTAHSVLEVYLPACDTAIRAPATAFSSVDLDSNGCPLTYRTALSGPDRAEWEAAHAEEWLRLIEESQCVHFVPMASKPPDVRATYYNPQVRVKQRPSGPERRVRGTAGGDRGTRLRRLTQRICRLSRYS